MKYIRNIIQTKTVRIFAVLIAVLTIYSCRKIEEMKSPVKEGNAVVKVSIKGDSFEGARSIGSRGSTTNTLGSNVQISKKAFNKDYDLVATLTAVEPMAANRAGLNRAGDTGSVGDNIRYKIVAYDDAGVYVDEQDYVRGQEGSAPDFKLKIGETYTFIAYSTNSTSVLPEIVFADPTNKTLGTSTAAINGTDDFMYYTQELTISGSADNNLNIVFKHKLSQITTTIDATPIGETIRMVTSSYVPHNTAGTVNLGDGRVARSGTAGLSAVVFSAFGTPVVTSLPTIINTDLTDIGSYRIASIRIGDVVQDNITAFSGLNIAPGVKYNLNLTVVPMDGYLEHEGQPAAKINGLIWMRHNLGANTALDPDQIPSIQALHGNYYQWGRSRVVATATTEPGTIPDWDVTFAPEDAWNTGTDANPIKTVNDPCPVGYRIPVLSELDNLRAATVHSNSGSWGDDPTNFSAAKVLVSIRNSAVRITLPITGIRVATVSFMSQLMGRGAYTLIWSSSNTIDSEFASMPLTSTRTTVSTSSGYSKIGAVSIRCIAQ